jgi:protein associated with RNAse G/E
VLHRSWPARLVRAEGTLLILDAVFQEDIDHNLLGRIDRGTISTEYYWTDRWYNVFRFSSPDQTLKQFYCNINLPPEFDGQVLRYVDLDIDVLVNPDFSYSILDRDDFEESARVYSYSEELQASAHQALEEIISLIDSRQFPFQS